MTNPDVETGLLSLRTTSEEHHARLVPHADSLLTLAEMVGHVDCAALHTVFEQEYRFVVEQLAPHMDAMEQALYPRMEQILSGHHSLDPMREEHRTIHDLIDEELYLEVLERSLDDADKDALARSLEHAMAEPL